MKIDWKHLFNWEIESVKAPEEVVKEGSIVGYRVVVTYKYHGTYVENYSFDNDRLYKVWVGPKEAAQVAYKQHLCTMRRQIRRKAFLRLK